MVRNIEKSWSRRQKLESLENEKYYILCPLCGLLSKMGKQKRLFSRNSKTGKV